MASTKEYLDFALEQLTGRRRCFWWMTLIIGSSCASWFGVCGKICRIRKRRSKIEVMIAVSGDYLLTVIFCSKIGAIFLLT